VALIAGFAVAAILSPLVAWAATRVGLVDRRGPLKVQQEAVPYAGGIAVLLALAVPVAVDRPSLLVPLGLACALGLVDDLRDLSVKIRLPAEAVLGFLVAWMVAPHDFWHLATALVVELVLLNAVNLLDGLDGLATIVTLAGAVGFSVVLSGQVSTMALALVGALAGFLVWNRPPARVYLGDAGSYLIGTALAVMFADAMQHGSSVVSGALLFVGVPVGDMVVAIVRRARARRPILQGDRGHVYDQLVDRGWSLEMSVFACAAVQVVLTAVGIGIASLPSITAMTLATATVSCVGITALVAFTSPRSWAAER
jgi:UDP-N-acetylmuramyl pentapeptide phosphotransferase/UDP-N-acetylglucosamine-1-phosphate transferase